jgi:hypothetical protein
MTPGYVLGLLRQCRVYDYERREWTGFCDAVAPEPAGAVLTAEAPRS